MCLKHRSRVWSSRAIAECNGGVRNWFGTLTVAPEHRTRLLYQAQLATSRACNDWTALDEQERFLRILKELAPECTKYVKRVRRNSGASLRYLLVVEAHKDGFPHFHMLVHEHDGAVTKRALQNAWKLGFTKWNLVNEGDVKQCFYVCKYLAKSALARIRASEEYGQAGPRLAALRLLPIVAALQKAGAAGKDGL